MKVKVCGIKYSNNLERLAALDLEMIGFNFYPPSKRYVANPTDLKLAELGPDIKRVGVFVNADNDTLKEKRDSFGLDYLQLHGDESVTYAREAQQLCPIIKVFRVGSDFDFGTTAAYDFADLFLFDTYTKEYGGSGERFQWETLSNYTGKIPFLLAGGISSDDSAKIKAISHPLLYGVDINSCFEIEPGLKDEDLVSNFIKKLK